MASTENLGITLLEFAQAGKELTINQGFTDVDDWAGVINPLTQGTPTITVGSESGDVINVAVQLKDAAGENVASAHVVRAWLSDSAGGEVTSTAPSGSVAIGTNGVVIAEHTAKTHLVVAGNASGQFDINITEAGARTWYLNLEYQGKLFSSAAITFA